MFAESASVAPQVVTIWPTVGALSVVSVVYIAIVRTLAKRWIQTVDDKVATVEVSLGTKVDVETFEAHFDGLKQRLDDVHEMMGVIYQKLNGGQPYKPPRRTKGG